MHITPKGLEEVADREQTVEIALGPQGAFENGNFGTLTRQTGDPRRPSAPGKQRMLQKPTTPRGG